MAMRLRHARLSLQLFQYGARKSTGSIYSLMENSYLRLNARQQVRYQSILGNLTHTIKDKLEDRKQEKEAMAYKDQIIAMASLKEFTLNTYLSELEKNAAQSGVKGWRSMIPGVSNIAGVAELKMNLKIVETIDEKYRQDPQLIVGRVKREIVEKSGHTTQQVNNMLRQYEQMRMMHKWLVKRVERQLPLPETQDESLDLLRADPTGISMKKNSMKRRNR